MLHPRLTLTDFVQPFANLSPSLKFMHFIGSQLYTTALKKAYLDLLQQRHMYTEGPWTFNEFVAEHVMQIHIEKFIESLVKQPSNQTIESLCTAMGRYIQKYKKLKDGD